MLHRRFQLVRTWPLGSEVIGEGMEATCGTAVVVMRGDVPAVSVYHSLLALEAALCADGQAQVTMIDPED